MSDNSEVPEDQVISRVRSPLLPSTTADPLRLLDFSTFTHTPNYCEENVYMLCKKLSMLGLADPKALDLFVVFISNEEKKVPLLYQKASKRFDGLVMWDYHVICIQTFLTIDTFVTWAGPESHNGSHKKTEKATFVIWLFRVVHAPIFIHCFASDRSHMRDPRGNWLCLPPIYEPIVAEDGAVNNLDEYIQMRTADTRMDVDALVDGVFSSKFGVVISESMLESFFYQIHLLTGNSK